MLMITYPVNSVGKLVWQVNSFLVILQIFIVTKQGENTQEHDSLHLVNIFISAKTAVI